MIQPSSNSSWRRVPWKGIVLVQFGLLLFAGVAYSTLDARGHQRIRQLVTGTATSSRLSIPRTKPLAVEPLYDVPSVVSDGELIDVLEKIRPRFNRQRLQPNYVEHALRAWGSQIDFNDPEVMDGPELVKYLTDYGDQIASFGRDASPLFTERGDGLQVNWGRRPGISVHHDHWLASLTEAGVPLDTPIYGPNRSGHTLNDALQEAIRDFEPNEQEVEWSVMAFGFWLPPDHRQWRNREGRVIDFNLLADRLMLGQKRFGVCGGTHRVYSLMVLLRIDDEFKILEPEMREYVYEHLRSVRDNITESQYPDGHWGTDWPDGKLAQENPLEEPNYRKVIATGHHLEWLAIAYDDLQIPREQVEKAADWLIATVRQTPQEEIMGQYTFFSHVGNALALWRNTHPATAWTNRQPDVELPLPQ